MARLRPGLVDDEVLTQRTRNLPSQTSWRSSSSHMRRGGPPSTGIAITAGPSPSGVLGNHRYHPSASRGDRPASRRSDREAPSNGSSRRDSSAPGSSRFPPSVGTGSVLARQNAATFHRMLTHSARGQASVDGGQPQLSRSARRRGCIDHLFAIRRYIVGDHRNSREHRFTFPRAHQRAPQFRPRTFLPAPQKVIDHRAVRAERRR